jgi:hypothetical protein
LNCWRIQSENQGYEKHKPPPFPETFFSIQSRLAVGLKAILSGGVLAEGQIPVLHQVLDKVAECSAEHLQVVVASIDYVISKVPKVQRGDHWGDLVASYLSLHTWIYGKIAAQSKLNFEEFGRVITHTLSTDPSHLKTVGLQSKYLNQKIPDDILHPVMDSFKKRRSNLLLSDLDVMVQSFTTVPKSFGKWIMYNSNCMYLPCSVLNSFFYPISSSLAIQFDVDLEEMRKWVGLAFKAKCPDLLSMLFRGWMLFSTEFPYEDLHSLIPDIPTKTGVIRAALEVTANSILCEEPLPFPLCPPAALYRQPLHFD